MKLIKKSLKEAKKSTKFSKFAVDPTASSIDRIKATLASEGMDVNDVRTYNTIHNKQLAKDTKLYVCAVTQDCPMDCIVVGGVDFPKFVQPIDLKNARNAAKSRRMNARPQRLKRVRLTDAQVTKIIKSGYEKWVDIQVPTNEKLENGTPVLISDRIRATFFLVLQEISDKQADPVDPRPLSNRPKSIEKLITKAGTVEDMLVESGHVRHTKKGTIRNIEAMKAPRVASAV